MASAFNTNMSRIDQNGETIALGDTVELQVEFFDNDEEALITILSVSVLFDKEKVTYIPGASVTPTYALYNAGGRANVSLAELSTNMTIRAGENDDQILLDWSSNALPNGTRDACGNYGVYPADPEIPSGNSCGFVMAQLVFEAIGEGDADFILSNNSPGNISQRLDGPDGPLIDFPNPVSGDFTVTIPEPTSASLSIFALLSLAGLRLRARRH